MANMKSLNQNSVAWIVMVLSIISSIFMIWFLLHTDKSVALRLESFEQTIANIKPINGKDVTLEQVAEAVGRYCEQRNNCSGLHGADSNVPGPMGLQGPPGLDGMTIQGPPGFNGTQGAEGLQGIQGEPGVPGRTLEQRCVVVDENTRRIEQKYTDAEDWQALYYLSKGQTCPQETA